MTSTILCHNYLFKRKYKLSSILTDVAFFFILQSYTLLNYHSYQNISFLIDILN